MTDAWTEMHRARGSVERLEGVAAWLRQEADEAPSLERQYLLRAATEAGTCAHERRARIDRLNRDIYGT